MNLLQNAIAYTPDGGKIEISLSQQESSVIVAVRDNGPGIPKKHLPRLFERFYRVDKARSRQLGGTGLGLAIVKHIVQAHGGSITATSEVNKGAVFTIHLPLHAPSQGETTV